ncbi:hypothetical protein DES53_102412 [Roseimicrobium gellanilyticum]|uniref:NACHT domain-containing protein n=1 Tax=Roseimicrobium gellanilyticum TaxID=748857 RepID=A0A366HRB5_9BACT|nr:HEAT repeat domain-containing protein [Roseimicrobium gellanilyticum]RBP46026.1 hypothetical protein DES53_102412 [Roseimicrobium gellanilyticum]
METPNYAEALNQFHAELSGIASRAVASEKASAKLQARLHGGVLGSHFHNQIDISNAVPRPRLRSAIKEWWDQEKIGVAVLQGEEGAGKTWVAADFAGNLAGDLPVVFWLDSLAWRQAANIEEVVHMAAESLFMPGDRRIHSVAKKVFQRWHDAVLLILDGANERGAWKAAEGLLYDYHQHGPELRSKLRLLFTSRPLLHRPGAGGKFWGNSEIIDVEPFDETEFAAALATFAPDLAPEALSEGIRKLASVPRYFQLCLRLRDRLSSLSHLTRDVLLLAELEAKLERRDPQWIDLHEELGSTPSEILSHLAKRIGWPEKETKSIATAELRQHLPGLDKARADLCEQRIFVTADWSETVLNSDHLVLGWALVIQRVTELQGTDRNSDQLCEHVQQMLEPAASNDHKARAVHLALLLTFLQPRFTCIQARTALFRLWALHHNNSLNVESLDFFVSNDLHSYIDAVEAFFREHLPGKFETLLITPLATRWRIGDDVKSPLKPILERWLRFVFPGDATGSKDGNEVPPSQLVAAQSPEQLRLSYAAIGIISFRPDTALLPALIDCHLSEEFCYFEQGTAEYPARFPIKSSTEPLGLLARWHLGESALKALAHPARDLPVESEEWQNLRSFARLWRMVKWPTLLGDAEDIFENGSDRGDSALFSEFRKVLDPTNTPRRNLIGLGLVGRLAMRRDLPLLTSDEIEEVVAMAEAAGVLQNVVPLPNSRDEHILDDLFPYLARYRRDVAMKALRLRWQAAIEGPNPDRSVIGLDECIPPTDPDGVLVQAALGLRQDPTNQNDFYHAAARFTELILCDGSTNDLRTWLRATETLTLPRLGSSYIGLLPLPMAFAELAPEGFDSIARHEFESALGTFENAPTANARKLASHWLLVFAYVLRKPSIEVGKWALELADRLKDLPEFRFPLFLIAARASDAELLEAAISHPVFVEFHFGFNAHRWGSALKADERPNLSWEAIRTYASFTSGGWLLYHCQMDEELRTWGRDLAAVALAAIPMESSSTPSDTLEIRVGSEGQYEGARLAPPSGEQRTWLSTSSPAWGGDRETNRPSATEADVAGKYDNLNGYVAKRRASSRRELAEFNAAGPLHHWSRIAIEEFVPWAEEFLRLAAAAGPAATMDIASFVDDVTISLLRLVPSAILDHQELWEPHPYVRVTSCEGAISRRTQVLWETTLNDFPVVRNKRRQMIFDTDSDEEILWQVLAAHAAGNLASIARFAHEWMFDGHAEVRALAVTLLAFQGDEDSLIRLAELRDGDPSFWVREHAVWASDVCTSEMACRERYLDILAAQSPEDIISTFIEIRPAFSPMVFAWIESEDLRTRLARQSPRNRVLIRLFWSHWCSVSSRSRNVSMGGRKLKEYCRGERLKDGVSSRMAPWWRLEP